MDRNQAQVVGSLGSLAFSIRAHHGAHAGTLVTVRRARRQERALRLGRDGHETPKRNAH